MRTLDGLAAGDSQQKSLRRTNITGARGEISEWTGGVCSNDGALKEDYGSGRIVFVVHGCNEEPVIHRLWSHSTPVVS